MFLPFSRMFFAFCNYSLPIQEDLIKKNKSLRLFRGWNTTKKKTRTTSPFLRVVEPCVTSRTCKKARLCAFAYHRFVRVWIHIIRPLRVLREREREYFCIYEKHTAKFREMIATSPRASSSASLALLASNNARAMHSATKKSAQKAPTFTRHRISSRSVRKNRAIKEPSDVTEKISDVKESPSSSSDDDGEKGGESIKRAPRPSTLNRPVSEAAVNSDAALANLRAAGGANGASLFRFLYQHHQVVVSLLSRG